MERINEYVVERSLGRGTFATVWLVRDPALRTHLAVKLLAENWSLDDEVKSRFLEEARILARLDHPRLIRVYSVSHLPDGRPFFVMEYADRGTLHERMRYRSASGEAFSLDEALTLSLELADCLMIAHDLGVIHRDLKPSNVLFGTIPMHHQEEMRRNGVVPPAERMKLIDFGIARQLEAATQYTISAGTPHYMAPEQGEGKADARSDIYACATILYELLAGEPPYPYDSLLTIMRQQQSEGPPSVLERRSDVPDDLAAVIGQGLAVDPADRIPTARAWANALKQIRRDRTRPSPTPRPRPAPVEGSAAEPSVVPRTVVASGDAEAIEDENEPNARTVPASSVPRASSDDSNKSVQQSPDDVDVFDVLADAIGGSDPHPIAASPDVDHSSVETTDLAPSKATDAIRAESVIETPSGPVEGPVSQPTIRVTRVDGERDDEASGPATAPQSDEAARPSRQRRLALLVGIPVILAMVVGAVMIFGGGEDAADTTTTIASTTTASTTTSTNAEVVSGIVVPNVVGLSVSGAQEVLGEVGFVMSRGGAISVSCDDPIGGLVAAQSPAAGMTTDGSAPVSVDVGVADCSVIVVPDVTGLSVADAQSALGDAGVVMSLGGSVELPCGNRNDGLVVGQDPASGVETQVGSAVVVSIGRAQC